MNKSDQELKRGANFKVNNIGGIDSTEIKVPPGVTVLTGENATNRTSFLQSIMAVMGSDRASLKADADEGHVRLNLYDEVYECSLKRTDNRVRFEGNRYLDDAEEADLFAFLLERNDARQAVAMGQDLREIIMRPVDTHEIQRDIERFEKKKNEIKDEISRIDSEKTKLPDFEERRTKLRKKIEKRRDDLAEIEKIIEESNREIEESQKERAELEEKLDELRSYRSDLNSVRRKIESQQESIASLKRELNTYTNEQEGLPDESVPEISDIKEEIERLRNQRKTVNSEISDLQSLIQFNEERLEEENYEILEALEQTEEPKSPGEVTEKLLGEDNESMVCWTCGTTVERAEIRDTIERLKPIREQKISKLNDIKKELEDLKDDQSEIKKKRRQREELQNKIANTEDEIEHRQTKLNALKETRDQLAKTVEEYNEAVEDLKSEDFNEILEKHKEANQIEFDIENLESELDEVTEEIEEIESMIEKKGDLRDELEEVREILTNRRTKIDRVEQETVSEFNDHMDSILDILNYENVDRIWIERLERTVKEGARKVNQTEFEIHIVRSTENGTSYEDKIEHLSESEREVTGLVFALAGYLVHDLNDEVPFMLLDSLEAIDSNRIASLVDYFANLSDYLIVALLEEDAQALGDEYHYIADI